MTNIFLVSFAIYLQYLRWRNTGLIWNWYFRCKYCFKKSLSIFSQGWKSTCKNVNLYILQTFCSSNTILNEPSLSIRFQSHILTVSNYPLWIDKISHHWQSLLLLLSFGEEGPLMHWRCLSDSVKGCVPALSRHSAWLGIFIQVCFWPPTKKSDERFTSNIYLFPNNSKLEKLLEDEYEVTVPKKMLFLF